jgi:hypothetical protein
MAPELRNDENVWSIAKTVILVGECLCSLLLQLVETNYVTLKPGLTRN